MNNKETLISHIEEHPKLRFKDIDGDFPDWKIKQLNEVCAIVGGGTPDTQKSEYWDGNIAWFTPSEIGFKKYVDKSQRTITKTGLLNSSAKLLPKGTILLSTRATIGEMSISSIECATNQGFHSLVVNNKIANTEYIYYLKNIIKKYCLKYSSGNTFKEINLSMLRKCLIPIPTLQEQQKIAAFLSLIDENIEKQELKLILLNKYKKGLLLSVFTSFSKDKIISLKELIDKNIIEIKRGNIIPKQNGIYPVYSSSIQNNGLFCYSDNYMFDEELVSWSIDGGGNFFYRPEHKFSLTNVTGYIKVKNKNILNTQYLYYNLDYLSHSYNFDYQNKALPSYISKLYKIYLPPIKVQEKTAKILSTFDELIEKENNILSLLKKYKQGLLQQMFI